MASRHRELPSAVSRAWRDIVFVARIGDPGGGTLRYAIGRD